MSEEKKLILEMFKDGKIDAEQAEKLLDAQANEVQRENHPVSKSTNKKFLRVLIREGDKTNVNINIPIALAEVGLKLVPKDTLKIEGRDINIQEILNLIHEGAEGELVNIETTENGKEVKVKIFIE